MTAPADLSAGLCVDHPDPEIWHATPKDGAADLAEAIRICGQCPVREACLTDRMTLEAAEPRSHRHGVAGGLTAHHRTLLAAGNLKPIPACGTEERYRLHRRVGEDCEQCRKAMSLAMARRRAGQLRQGRIAAGLGGRRVS